jgi:hypothetical protein
VLAGRGQLERLGDPVERPRGGDEVRRPDGAPAEQVSRLLVVLGEIGGAALNPDLVVLHDRQRDGDLPGRDADHDDRAEPAERRSHQGEPRTHRDPALDARWVLDQGGDALKFFVQLRADRPAPAPGEPDLVAEALAVCEEIIRDGRATGVPVVIENLVYARPGEDLRGQAREDAIIEAARALNDLDIDLLKLEYPGSPAGCRRLAAILHRPWAVLSAGVPFDQFTDIIRIAADEGGASGFIAGRSVWREVAGLAGPHREEFLTTVARPRLERLIEVAEHRARPWTEATRPYPTRRRAQLTPRW